MNKKNLSESDTLVEHLRSLCADLRQRLTQSQTTQTALADALVAG